MKLMLVFAPVIATLLVSCGGGGGAGAPDDTASRIRFEGEFLAPASVAIRPMAGQGSISTKPVERVEIQVGSSEAVVLRSPNSADGQGRPQFLVDFGDLPATSGCNVAAPTLPIRIKIVDTSGFEFTKDVGVCPSRDVAFSGLSDYGTHTANATAIASVPLAVIAARTSPTGYVDTTIESSGRLKHSFAVQNGDRLDVMTPPDQQVADYTTIATRVEASNGEFAESIILTQPSMATGLAAGLLCCQPRNGSGPSSVLRLTASATLAPGAPAEAAYRYSYRVSDPLTGALVAARSGKAPGNLALDLPVAFGRQVDFEAAPDDSGLRVSIRVNGNLEIAHAESQRVGAPARIRTYCCTR